MCPANATAYGEAAATELLRSDNPPDVIAAMSDELALRSLPSAAQAGFGVPGGMAVTGWDDRAAAADAGLTTLRQSLRDQGRRCARIAVGRPGPPAGTNPPTWGVIARASARWPKSGSARSCHAVPTMG